MSLLTVTRSSRFALLRAVASAPAVSHGQRVLTLRQNQQGNQGGQQGGQPNQQPGQQTQKRGQGGQQGGQNDKPGQQSQNK